MHSNYQNYVLLYMKTYVSKASLSLMLMNHILTKSRQTQKFSYSEIGQHCGVAEISLNWNSVIELLSWTNCRTLVYLSLNLLSLSVKKIRRSSVIKSCSLRQPEMNFGSVHISSLLFVPAEPSTPFFPSSLPPSFPPLNSSSQHKDPHWGRVYIFLLHLMNNSKSCKCAVHCFGVSAVGPRDFGIC